MDERTMVFLGVVNVTTQKNTIYNLKKTMRYGFFLGCERTTQKETIHNPQKNPVQ